MFKQLVKDKVIRDPIHEYINIDLAVIWECIDTLEFQRLRRIHQLGATYQVFPTGEHSRFSHSLGVYQITRRMIQEVIDIKTQLTEFEKVAVQLAGLLHDLGHGPFSHSFEAISHCNHEQYTLDIIRGDTDVHRVLIKHHPDLPESVAQIIEKTHPNKLLCQMISGQLDADRMDYLLRDSYFTGTQYGKFDLGRILRSLRVKDQRLVIKQSGMHSIENYIMARYHMYWQVYYHPVSRSYEIVLTNLFKRLQDLSLTDATVVQRYPMFSGVLAGNQPTYQDLLALDEATCFYGFSLMKNDPDSIIQDLSNRIFKRRLFTYKTIAAGEDISKYEQLVQRHGFDIRYYVAHDTAVQRPYQPYIQGDNNLIWVLTEDQRVKELSEVSEIVRAIAKGDDKKDTKVFYPKEIEEEIK